MDIEISGHPTGWQCPVCKRVYSPETIMCLYCGNEEETTTATSGTETKMIRPKEKEERETASKNILDVLRGQTSAMEYAFDPRIMEFRNQVIELQKNCKMVEWDQDMGKTIPYCKIYKTLCNGQCVFKDDDNTLNECKCWDDNN